MRTFAKKICHKSRKFLSGYYNTLLVSLILLFVFRPHTSNLLYFGIWKLLLTITLLAAVYNCRHSKIVGVTITILAIPAVLFNWINLIHPAIAFFLINVISTILFMLISAGSIIHDVILKARVTIDTLKGVICAYFMMGFLFAYIYYLIEYLVAGSFSIQKSITVFDYALIISEMLYFSFVTLMTIGYGDIVATKNAGQTAVVLEGIVGQFYIAILVSRLVSVYSVYSNKRVSHLIEHHTPEEK